MLSFMMVIISERQILMSILFSNKFTVKKKIGVLIEVKQMDF